MKYPRGPRVKVSVNQDEIHRGVTADSTRCMITEAIKRTLPFATSVAVDLQTCRFSDLDKGHRYVYLTPYSAQVALLNFDEGIPPKPFTFILKNAHVSGAGQSDATKSRRARKKAEAQSKIPPKAELRATKGKRSGNLPRRVGGKRPPQLKMMRQFGIRAFRGASGKRILADAELTDRATI